MPIIKLLNPWCAAQFLQYDRWFCLCRRVRGQLPELSPAEMQRFRSSMYGMAAIGHIPRVNMGRDRFAAARPPQGELRPLKLSPQAREAARRTYNSGAVPLPPMEHPCLKDACSVFVRLQVCILATCCLRGNRSVVFDTVAIAQICK